MGSHVESVDILRAVPGDAPALTDIARASKAHWGYETDLLDLWNSQLTVSPEFVRDQPVWVAVEHGRPIGFCAIVAGGEEWEIGHLWVHPEWIGRGIGRTLFERAVAEAASAGATAVRVVSDPHAKGFYLHMGARHVGEEDSVPEGRRLPLLVFELGESRIR
jgi:GNAT superfamily N-acetyltransferase